MRTKGVEKWETKKCEKCNTEFEALKSRKQRFCCNKCSTLFTANDKNRINKIKETKLKRYGSENYVNVKKAKQTCLEKYGVDNASKNIDVQKKIKQSNKEKFGCESYFQTDEFKQKTKKTLGVENISQLDSTKNKVKQTVQKKFGVDNVFQSEDIKQKIKESYLEKYGVEYPSQSQFIKHKINKSFRESFYEKLCTTHKLNLKVESLFSADDYVNSERNNKYKFKCLNCDGIFEDHIDGGHLPRCTTCYPLNKGSVCEKEIYQFLTEIMSDYKIYNNCRNVISGELDIYIEDKKIAIEYDSFYFHSQSHVGKKYHINKTNMCESLGIRLIHIFEDEWITKQEIIKNKIKNICGSVDDRVYARNCEIKEITANEKNTFLNQHHIQGEDKSKIKLGLFHETELVAVMTFCNLRVALGSSQKIDTFELSRFATSKSVIGGASKLFTYFTNNYKPNQVISYADRRFSWKASSLYDKLGFSFDSTTPPNYWYFKNGYNKRHHRFNFRKSELSKKLDKFDSSLTEYENMQLNGYDRIWDCGSLKYTWSPKS